MQQRLFRGLRMMRDGFLVFGEQEVETFNTDMDYDYWKDIVRTNEQEENALPDEDEFYYYHKHEFPSHRKRLEPTVSINPDAAIEDLFRR